MKKKYVLPLAALVAVLALGLFVRQVGTKTSSNVNSQYYTVPVQKGSIDSTVSGSGTVAASNRRVILAGVPGDVGAVYVSEGQKVDVGTPIAKITNPEVELKEKEAQADLQQAELKLRETLSLGPMDPLPTDFSGLEDLTSPVAGRVNNVSVSPGEKVRQDQVLLVIADESILTFEALVSPLEVKNVSLGDKAQIRIDGFDGMAEGTVTQIADYAVLDGQSQWMPVYIRIDGQTVFKPGMTGQAYIHGQGGTVVRSGTIAPTADKKITSRVNAEVEKVLVREGQIVKAGDTLIRFKEESLRVAVETQLVEIEKARASLLAAKTDVESLNVNSPIQGVVVDLPVEEGDHVQTGSTIAVVADLRNVKVMVNVDELEIRKLKLGHEAEVRIEAIPEKVYRGEITDIAQEGQSTKEGVTTYAVTIQVDNAEGLIRAGMTASATVNVEHREGVLVVPSEAVETRGDASIVQVLVGDKVERRPVQIGLTNARLAEIRNGLSEGEQVVVAAKTPASQGRPQGFAPVGVPPGGGQMIIREGPSGGGSGRR